MLELHPLSTLFPRMEGQEFKVLCEDIRANGLLHPIITVDGMILDGGNRYRACLEVGIEPVTREFEGPSIVDYVLSANLHRRHMTPGQQAAIVAAAADWSKAQPQGRPGKSVHVNTLSTTADRAALSGASTMTQRRADKVAKADPELAREVAHGKVSLPQAVAKVEGKEPKPQVHAPDLIEELEQRNAELAKSCEELLAENDALHRIVDADDRVAEALKMVKEYREREAILQSRIDGLMNECAAHVRHIKVLQKQAKAFA